MVLIRVVGETLVTAVWMCGETMALRVGAQLGEVVLSWQEAWACHLMKWLIMGCRSNVAVVVLTAWVELTLLVSQCPSWLICPKLESSSWSSLVSIACAQSTMDPRKVREMILVSEFLCGGGGSVLISYLTKQCVDIIMEVRFRVWLIKVREISVAIDAWIRSWVNINGINIVSRGSLPFGACFKRNQDISEYKQTKSDS